MDVKHSCLGVVVSCAAVWALTSVSGASRSVSSARPAGGPSVRATLFKIDTSWRPVGGPNANAVRIRAEIDSQADAVGRFRFILYDISREPGWCLNAGSDSEPDFRFAGNQGEFGSPRSNVEGFAIEGTAPARGATIEVRALDSGGFARLRAEVDIDGRWQPIPAEDGKAFITIPRDENDNRIADGWEEACGVAGQPAEDDRDAEPAGLEEGDGFSNYEEYRGFVMAGRWSDTSPGLKDIFIIDEAGFGVGHFVSTGLAVHYLGGDEVANPIDRIVNVNRLFATAGPQKAVRIIGTSLAEELFGKVEPAVGTPDVIERVGLDMNKALSATPETRRWALAHLLGHAVNIPHHGDFSSERNCGKEPGYVGLPGQVHSGDADCVMRYPFAFLFYDPGDERCYPYPIEDMFGSGYCSAPAGTGVNGGLWRVSLEGYPLPMAGDASRGGCRTLLALKGMRAAGQKGR